MMAWLPRNAKMALDPLTVARRTSLMEAAVSFLALPIQLGNPQIVPFSLTLILIMSDHFLIIIFSAVKKMRTENSINSRWYI